MMKTHFVAGDGFKGCTPNAQLATLASMYVTDGPARIACTEGSNIAYPAAAPGWVDDPTGSVQSNPALAVNVPKLTAQTCHTPEPSTAHP